MTLSSPVRRLVDPLALAWKLGPWRSVLYTLHQAKTRTGWYRARTPMTDWSPLPDNVTATAASIFEAPDTDAVRRHLFGREEAIRAGERIERGSFLYFFHHWLERPADWRTSPLTGKSAPDLHWCSVKDFDAAAGDVKWIWEPSRFDWIYQLARAWAASGDERFVALMWELFESWRDANPPNRGVHWKSGQECALRLFALVWASAAFRDATATTSSRTSALWEVVATLARRIELSLGYALAQNNNHGLSESAALYVAGHCLPSHPRAARWRRVGRKLFERQLVEQFAEDGSYIQHSFNYQRFALRVAFIALRCAGVRGETFSASCTERLRASVELLVAAQDPETGAVPNYGANDGANVMALSGTDYLDFRPALSSLNFLLDGTRLYPEGPHDEELAWHFPPGPWPSTKRSLRPPTFAANEGGYYVLRTDNAHGLLRCHSFTTRPGHADLLHLDLWIGGKNILADSGTYRYFDERSWGSYFKSTAAHNTLTVDGADQMRRYRRFLWADWARAKLLRVEARPDGSLHWEGEHYGYSRGGVVHRRAVYARGDEWLVVDDVLCAAGSSHELALLWHLGGTDDWRARPRELDSKFEVRSDALSLSVNVALDPSDRCELAPGGSDDPHTATSSYYGALTPTALLRVSRAAAGPCRFLTAIGPKAAIETGARTLWNGEKFDTGSTVSVE